MRIVARDTGQRIVLFVTFTPPHLFDVPNDAHHRTFGLQRVVMPIVRQLSARLEFDEPPSLHIHFGVAVQMTLRANCLFFFPHKIPGVHDRRSVILSVPFLRAVRFDMD